MKSSGKIFREIGELMTLSGVVKKKGRHVTEKDLGVRQKMAFAVRAGQIQWIGLEAKIPKEFSNYNEVFLNKRNVFPGFVDCHTHLVFAGNRTNEFELRNKGMSYQDIANQGGGILSTVKATKAASEKNLIEVAQKRVEQHLSQGVTTVEIKSGYGLSRKAEIKMLKAAGNLKKIRVIKTFLGAHAIPLDHDEDSYLELLKKDLLIIKKEKLAERVDIFVEKNYFSPQKSQEYLEFAQSLGFDLTIHADQMSLSGGAELAVKLNAQSADHVICIKEKEIKRLATSSTVAVLLPAADFYLQCDYPPARKLIEKGALVALATDFNPGSSPTQNISFVGLLARLKMKMTLPEVFSALTYGGATALGLEEECGALTKNRKADFFTSEKSWQDYFYGLEADLVDATYVAGKRVYKN